MVVLLHIIEHYHTNEHCQKQWVAIRVTNDYIDTASRGLESICI